MKNLGVNRLKDYKRIIEDKYSLFYKRANSYSSSFLEEILKSEYCITDYEIIKNKNGKQYLKNKDLFFNISHKRDMLVIVLSNTEVGVDVEYIEGKYIKNTSILKYFFTAKEKTLISNNIELKKIWTQKESYIKLVGGKLSDIIGLDLDTKQYNNKTYNIENYIVSVSWF